MNQDIHHPEVLHDLDELLLRGHQVPEEEDGWLLHLLPLTTVMVLQEQVLLLQVTGFEEEKIGRIRG